MRKLISKRLIEYPVLALVAGMLGGCDKPAAPAPDAKPAAPQVIISAAALTPAPALEKAAAPAAQAKVDVASLEATYGFLAKLPKSTETFSAGYKLHDLWLSFSNSKFAAAALELPFMKEDSAQKFLGQWRDDPNFQNAKKLAAALWGNEFIVAQPAGAGKSMKPWLAILSELQDIRMRGLLQAVLSGKSPTSDTLTREAFTQSLPDLLPLASDLGLPPTLLIHNVGVEKATLEASMNQMLGAILESLPPFVQKEEFKVADKYSFTGLSVLASEAIPAQMQVEYELQLKNMLGDEAQAKELLAKLLTKRVEIAWGWVDNYLVISLGSDHAFVQLATSPADSILGVPTIAARAAEFAARKPLTFSYASKTTFDAIHKPLSIKGWFDEFTADLQNVVKPQDIVSMRKDVGAFDAKLAEAMKVQYEDMVTVGWFENGLRGEIFGGVKVPDQVAPAPLGLGNAFTPATLLLVNGRKNPAVSDRWSDLTEQAAVMVWRWYDTFGREMIPDDSRPVFATYESLAVPLIKDFWNSSRQVGKALGNESALVLDLNGAMPESPFIPPQLGEGRVPRFAYIAELKDRAALSEAWTGYQRAIKQITNFLPAQQGQPMHEPVSRKEGDAEIFHLPMPIETGDLLPHVGVSANRWIISSSPSLTKELVAKASATAASSEALAARGQLNLNALWDYADLWVKLAGVHLGQIAGESSAKDFENNRPLIEAMLQLGHCVEGLDWKASLDQGTPRQSTHLQFHDLK